MYRIPRPASGIRLTTPFASVVMCGCPVITPMGWMFVWQAIAPKSDANPTPSRVAPRPFAREHGYLAKFARPN